ncbi:MAG: phosphodiester glycosidase family protein [Gemmatimonas sp.]
MPVVHRRSLTVAAVTLVIAASVFVTHTARAQTGESTKSTSAIDARPIISDYSCTKPAAPVVANVLWKSDDGSIKWGEWRVRLGSQKLPIVVIVAVVTSRRTQLSLDIKRDGDQVGAWSIANAPANARFALNAGQFTDDGPWGWVVHRGNEQQKPGTGVLAGALIVDTAGRWSVIDANEILAHRWSLAVREAVQSYPTLVGSLGRIPAALCADSKDVDRTHRDTRLVVGTRISGELILAMTRFDGLGEPAQRLPIGPTSLEMVEIMRALGAARALMLDGGLSAQLLIRTANSAIPKEWAGWRKVPLALIGIPTPMPPLRN